MWTCIARIAAPKRLRPRRRETRAQPQTQAQFYGRETARPAVAPYRVCSSSPWLECSREGSVRQARRGGQTRGRWCGRRPASLPEADKPVATTTAETAAAKMAALQFRGDRRFTEAPLQQRRVSFQPIHTITENGQDARSTGGKFGLRHVFRAADKFLWTGYRNEI